MPLVYIACPGKHMTNKTIKKWFTWQVNHFTGKLGLELLMGFLHRMRGVDRLVGGSVVHQNLGGLNSFRNLGCS